MAASVGAAGLGRRLDSAPAQPGLASTELHHGQEVGPRADQLNELAFLDRRDVGESSCSKAACIPSRMSNPNVVDLGGRKWEQKGRHSSQRSAGVVPRSKSSLSKSTRPSCCIMYQ